MQIITRGTKWWNQFINSLYPRRSGCWRCNFQSWFTYWYLHIFLDNALRWVPQYITDDKPTLAQVWAWCHQATSHYLNQWWPSSLTYIGGIRGRWAKKRRHSQGHCVSFGAIIIYRDETFFKMVHHLMVNRYCKCKCAFNLVDSFTSNSFHSTTSSWMKNGMITSLNNVLYLPQYSLDQFPIYNQATSDGVSIDKFFMFTAFPCLLQHQLNIYQLWVSLTTV